MKMVVVTARVLTAPKVEQLEGETSLEILQSVVGGYIETAARKRSETQPGVILDVYCNEEGRMYGLPVNRVIPGAFAPFVGNLVITAALDGETIDMDQELVLEALAWAKTWPVSIPSRVLSS